MSQGSITSSDSSFTSSGKGQANIRVFGRGGLGSRSRTHKSQLSESASTCVSPAQESISQRLSQLHLSDVLKIGREEPDASDSVKPVITHHNIPSTSKRPILSTSPASPPQTVRFSGRGGAGSRLRVVNQHDADSAHLIPDSRLISTTTLKSHSRSASSSILAVSSPSPQSENTIVRFAGRGGAGSRPRHLKAKPQSDKHRPDFILVWKTKSKGKGKERAADLPRAPSIDSASTRSSIITGPITPTSQLHTSIHHYSPSQHPSPRVSSAHHHDTPVYSLSLPSRSLGLPNDSINDTERRPHAQASDSEFYTSIRSYRSTDTMLRMPLEIMVTTTTTTSIDRAASESKVLRRISVSTPNLKPLPSPSSIYQPSIASFDSESVTPSAITQEENSLAETWIDDLYEPAATRPISTIIFSDPLPISPPLTPGVGTAFIRDEEESDDDICFAQPSSNVVSKSPFAYAFVSYPTESMDENGQFSQYSLENDEVARRSTIYDPDSPFTSSTPCISILGSTLDLTYG